MRSKDSLTKIATEIASRVEPVLNDLLNTLTGNDADVVDKRFLEWRDAVVQFGQDMGDVITRIVMPTFRAIGEASNLAARGINQLFGADFSGGAVLLTLAIGKVTGAFALLNATAKLALATIGFFVKHPAIAAVLVLTGRLATLGNQQSIADQAADEHRIELDDLDAAMARVGTASSGARDNLRKEAEASLAAAVAKRELIKAAADEIALANAVRKAYATVGPSANRDALIARIFEEERKAIEAYVGEQDKLIAGLQVRARELSKADRETVALTESTNEAADAIEEAGEKARRAFPGPAANVRSLIDSPFAKAKEDAEGFADTAETSGRQAETAFGKVVSVTDTLGPAASRAGSETKAAMDDAATSAGTLAANVRQVPEALAEAGTAAQGALEPVGAALKGIEAQATTTAQVLPGLFTEAANAMAEAFAAAFTRIKFELASLQSAVVSAISRMAAELSRLRQEIAATLRAASAAASAASSAASGGWGGGGAFAGGGMMSGPGTGTSDEVPNWASAGEAVLRERAVSYYGWPALSLFNDLRIPREALAAFLKGMRGFRDGGLVMPRVEMPRFNAGGIIDSISHSLSTVLMVAGGPVPAMAVASGGSGNNVTFVLDNERVEGFTATDDAVARLGRLFNRQKMTQAGRGPARLRG